MTILGKNVLSYGYCFLIGAFMLTTMHSSLNAQMKNASSENKQPSTQVPRAVSPVDPAQITARKAWHVSMVSRKLPKPGCFSASYPHPNPDNCQ
jgi:hypothetical protein